MNDILALVVGVAAGLAAIAGTFYLTRSQIKAADGPRRPPPSPEALIRDNLIVDIAPDFSACVNTHVSGGYSWAELRASMAYHFGNLPETLPSAAVSIASERDPQIVLSILPEQGYHRLVLQCPDAEIDAQDQVDRLGSPSARASEVAPHPAWLVDHHGIVRWSNPAFKRIREFAAIPEGASTPFNMDEMVTAATESSRVSVLMLDGTRHWFEVSRQPVEEGFFCFASGIDTLVEAEMAQRNFVQTLTKTFAHLPIGLAVFDRERRLVLFNPALVDLTRLPVDFLSARPNLMSFFDHMRENQMMAEPKNYASWRDKLSEVVSAAKDDRYCETWNLPTGLTYKITGRPHPDGAIAFLIEDISAEISLTRRFRSELELSQAVIDRLEEAVAVFSQLGVLTFSNASYRELWKCDPDSAFAEMTVADATLAWKDACQPSPIWSEIRDFVLTMRDRAAWTAPLVMNDGRRVFCKVEPVTAGATVVRFSIEPASAPAPVAEIADIDG